jgi:hypothetical protein
MALNLSAFQKNIQPKKKTNLNLSAFGITQEKTQQPAQPQSIWRNIPTATDWRKTLPMSIAKPQEQPKQNLLQSAVSGIENIGKGVSEFKSSFGEGWNRGVLSTGSVIERVASLGARNVGLQDISQKLDTLAEKDKELATYGIDVVDTRKFTEKIKDPNFIAKGIGQNLPNMLVAMGAAAPAAIAGAPTAVVGGIGFLTSGMLEGGFAYEDALSMGVDKKKAEKIAGVVGVINGLLETLPITKLLTRSKAGKDIKRSLIREITKRTVAQASMEAGTESIQEIVSNSLATIYDKNRDILSGVPESALFGGIMGGGMSTAIDVAGRVKNVGLTIEDVSGQELEAEARKYKTADKFVKAKTPNYITVYHRTNSPIETFGKGGIFSKENANEFFVSNKKNGQAEGYGKNVIELRVKKSDLSINDEFPSGEKHYTLNTSKADNYLKIKSRLTDIWNKANKKPINLAPRKHMSKATDNLANEARKYKSAEEFVKNYDYIRNIGINNFDFPLTNKIVEEFGITKKGVLIKKLLPKKSYLPDDIIGYKKGHGGTIEQNDFQKIENAISKDVDNLPVNLSSDLKLSKIEKNISNKIARAWEINKIIPHGYNSYSPIGKLMYEQKDRLLKEAIDDLFKIKTGKIIYGEKNGVIYFDIDGRQVSFHSKLFDKISNPNKILGYDLVKKKINEYNGEWIGVRTNENPLEMTNERYSELLKFTPDKNKSRGFLNEIEQGFGEENIKIKSRLTDIWNQANKKPPAKGGLPELGKAKTGTPIYRGQSQKGEVSFNETRFLGNTDGGVFFTKDKKTAEKYGGNIIKNISTEKNTVSVKESDKLQKMASEQVEKDLKNMVESDELIEQMALGRPKAFAEYTKKPFIETGDKFGEPGELIYYKELDKTPATSGLPELPKLPTKKDLPLKQTTPAVKKPQELTTQPTPRGEATPIEAKAPRTKSTLNTPAEAISNSESQILDYAGQKVDVSLDNIIDQMPTPVKRKVNAVDWLIRTPEKVLRKIGLGKEMDNLRKGYDAYLKELPKNIDKITEWTKQVPTKENNQNIFLYLDGQDVKLNPTELKVAGEIKTWLSEWADRLKLPKDNRITHYITHLFDEQLIKKEFDEDLAKIISQKIPGSVYDPFLIKRLGAKGYKVDTWAALDAYVKRGTRKVNLDPALEKIDEIAPSLEQSQWDYLKEYIDRVNLRPTKIDTSIDNTIKSVVGYKFGQRPTAMISRVVRQAGYRGGLWFNVSSTLRNLSQGINTYAVLGEKYTALGYAKLFSKANRQEIIDQGVLNAGFIDDRILSATQKLWQKADNVGFAMFQAVEGINRGSAYLGAKAKALSMGKTESQAIEYGKKIARETQFTFGSIDTPLAFSNDIVKTLMQFQTYTTKQVEFLSELAKDKNFGALARYTAAGLLYVATIGQAFGMDWKELIPAWRLPAPPAGKFLATTAGAILNAPDKYGNQRDFPKKLKDIAATAWGIVPGGSQAKKTIQGYQSIQDGGSYDAAGRLQFKQDQSTAGQLQSLLFGKYAGQNAQNYFDKKGIKTKESGLPALPKLPKLPTLPKLPQL